MRGECDGVLNGISRQPEDEIVFVVKSVSLADSIEQSQLENEIEHLTHLFTILALFCRRSQESSKN
jgi:hypothetical protein